MGGLSPDPLWAELVQILVSMVGPIVVYTKWGSLLLGPPEIMNLQNHCVLFLCTCFRHQQFDDDHKYNFN